MAILPSTLRKEQFTAALIGRSEIKWHINLLYLWFHISFSIEKLTYPSARSYLSRLHHPSFLLSICSGLAVSVLCWEAVTIEQGMAEAWSVLALFPGSLNKPGTTMFTTVFPAYRFVNLFAFLSSPFYPCWFLAVGSACCEYQPLDPVGIFHPETIFAE